MVNLKLKLFEFKKTLTYEQSDIENISEAHMKHADEYSEKELITSLNQQLSEYEYFENVKSLLEDLNTDMNSDSQIYELKDIYRKIERNDNAELYRHPLRVLLEIINTSDNTVRMEKILNDLSQYEFIPEIRNYLFQISTKPQDKQRYSSGGGCSDDIYSIAMLHTEGFLCFVKDRWFLLSENNIETVTLETYITDDTELRKYRLLEEAVRTADINDKRIEFYLDENLSVGLSVDKPGILFINDVEADKETTLESLFSSPIVPYMSRNFYPVIAESEQSIDKFCLVDVVAKVRNVTNPYLECYAFNYKNNVYLYRADRRDGNTMFKYESATKLVDDVRKELDYDLTYFFENKLPKEAKKLKTLEDNEVKIKSKIEKIDEALSVLADHPDLKNHNDLLKKAENKLLSERHKWLEIQKTQRSTKNNLLTTEFIEK